MKCWNYLSEDCSLPDLYFRCENCHHIWLKEHDVVCPKCKTQQNTFLRCEKCETFCLENRQCCSACPSTLPRQTFYYRYNQIDVKSENGISPSKKRQLYKDSLIKNSRKKFNYDSR